MGTLTGGGEADGYVYPRHQKDKAKAYDFRNSRPQDGIVHHGQTATGTPEEAAVTVSIHSMRTANTQESTKKAARHEGSAYSRGRDGCCCRCRTSMSLICESPATSLLSATTGGARGFTYLLGAVCMMSSWRTFCFLEGAALDIARSEKKEWQEERERGGGKIRRKGKVREGETRARGRVTHREGRMNGEGKDTRRRAKREVTEKRRRYKGKEEERARNRGRREPARTQTGAWCVSPLYFMPSRMPSRMKLDETETNREASTHRPFWPKPMEFNGIRKRGHAGTSGDNRQRRREKKVRVSLSLS